MEVGAPLAYTLLSANTKSPLTPRIEGFTAYFHPIMRQKYALGRVPSAQKNLKTTANMNAVTTMVVTMPRIIPTRAAPKCGARPWSYLRCPSTPQMMAGIPVSGPSNKLRMPNARAARPKPVRRGGVGANHWAWGGGSWYPGAGQPPGCGESNELMSPAYSPLV